MVRSPKVMWTVISIFCLTHTHTHTYSQMHASQLECMACTYTHDFTMRPWNWISEWPSHCHKHITCIINICKYTTFRTIVRLSFHMTGSHLK